MYRTKFISNHIYKLGSLCLLLALLYFFMPGTISAYADSMPGGNVADPSVRAVDIAQPAVVRIITTLHAHLAVHFSSTSDVTFPQTNNDGYALQLSGTGTFITARGDILTADHVVSPPKDQSLTADLYTTAGQDIADYLNHNAQAGAAQLTKEQVVQQLTSGQLSSTPTYATPNSVALLSTGYTGPLSATDFNSLPAGVATPIDKIEKESAPDQQDTAIVHTALQDTPLVQLADSSNVSPQDQLTIIGFPGNADVNQKPTDFLTSSINNISVSSIKTSVSGAPLIQVGGNVEHGDSGGPALDKQGNVVGIVSFGLVGSNNSGGTSFLQASNSARTMISQLDLNTQPGQFQKSWSQAFTDYAATSAGHWHKARNEFQQLATAYPTFKAVQPYQTYAQAQSGQEPQVPPTPTPLNRNPQHTTPSVATAPPVSFPAIALTVGAVVLLLLLIVLFFGITLRRRKTGPDSTVGSNNSTPVMPSANLPTPRVVPQKPMVAGSAQPVPATPVPRNMQSTLTLKAWPCGHMNRPNARFCSVCGESAPPTSTSSV